MLACCMPLHAEHAAGTVCKQSDGSRELFFFLLTILYYLSASHFRAFTSEVPTGPPAARARACTRATGGADPWVTALPLGRIAATVCKGKHRKVVLARV